MTFSKKKPFYSFDGAIAFFKNGVQVRVLPELRSGKSPFLFILAELGQKPFSLSKKEEGGAF